MNSSVFTCQISKNSKWHFFLQVCNCFVDLTEKMVTARVESRGLLKLMVPCLMSFVQDILASVILSRKLAATCAKYLASVCQPSNKAGAVATAKPPLQLIEEALECSHHGAPVRGVIGILQLIVIENPVACLWISLGEDRTGTVTEGSPLDLLPVNPSQLPVAQTVLVLYPNFQERILEAEEEIRKRSVAVEDKWLSKKTLPGNYAVTEGVYSIFLIFVEKNFRFHLHWFFCLKYFVFFVVFFCFFRSSFKVVL